MVCPLDTNNPNLRVYVSSNKGEGVEDNKENDVTETQHNENFLETEQPRQPVVGALVETIHPDYDPEKTRLPKFSPQELIGLTFLHDTEDGQRIRAEVIWRIQDKDSENHKNID